MAKVEKLLIFLASPGELKKERQIVEDVAAELNHTIAPEKEVYLQVTSWENDAYPGHGSDAQSLINEQIADMAKYSLFVGIMWNRLGTPTPRAESGTVEEFDRAVDAFTQSGQPDIWFYFRQATSSLDAEQQEQQKKVQAFRKRVQTKGMPWTYKNSSDFKTMFRNQITLWLNNRTHKTKALNTVSNATDKIATSIPVQEIKTYLDYDRNVEEFNRFLKWLIEEKKVCDSAILYKRDELDVYEFNLIAHYGLKDPSPMFGPLVFDDHRHKLDERFEEEISIPSNENPEGFRAREGILSRAPFQLTDKDEPIATLYLNWRTRQHFTTERQEEIKGYKDYIFSALRKIKGTSTNRQKANNAELRSRRLIDYSGANHKDSDDLIIEVLHCFFRDFEQRQFKIEIMRKVDTGFIITKKQYYRTGYDRPITEKKDPKDENIKHHTWVARTTRPKYLTPSPHNNHVYKIIVPMRLPPDFSECSGTILIESLHKPLITEFVKPLCFLADHFGRIDQLINRANDVQET